MTRLTQSSAPGRSRAGPRLPLDWWRDPRWAALGPGARDFFTLVLAWAADNLSDGAIPAPALRMLGSLTIEIVGDDVDAVIKRLVDAGLLVLAADGSATVPMDTFRVFCLTKTEVEVLQAKRRSAGQVGGAARIGTAQRDPTTGRLLPATDGWPDTLPDELPDTRPDTWLDEAQASHQTSVQAAAQARPPSPVPRSSLAPSSLNRTPTPSRARAGARRATNGRDVFFEETTRTVRGGDIEPIRAVVGRAAERLRVPIEEPT